MKIYVLLLAVAIATAAPGQFYHHQQFQKTAGTYNNDELQHKVEDAGYYTKHGDTDSDIAPKENYNFINREYNKPKNNEEQVPLANFGQREIGNRFSHSWPGPYNQKPYLRPWNSFRSRPIESPSSGGLVEIDDDKDLFSSNIDKSRYQTPGSGREYLENTEGGTRNVKPVYEPTEDTSEKDILEQQETELDSNKPGKPDDSFQQSQKTFEDYDFGGQQKFLHTGNDKLEYGGQQQEDLSQQNQKVFEDYDYGGQQKEDISHLPQTTNDKLELGGQQVDLSQQNEKTGYEFGGQQKEDMSHFSQIGNDKYELDQLEDLSQKHQATTFDYDYGGQQKEDMSHFSEIENHKYEPDQQQEDLSQKHQTTILDYNYGGQQKEDMSHLSQTDDKYEFGGQAKDESQFTQTTSNKFVNIEQEQEDLSQQNKKLFEDYDFGGQQKEDMSHFSQNNYENQHNGQQQEDLSQQHQKTFEDYNYGGQQKEDISHLSTNNKNEFNGQQQKDLTQQYELEFGNDKQDKNQEDLTQKEMGVLEYGEQQNQKETGEYDDLTQQSQTGFEDYKDKQQKDNEYYDQNNYNQKFDLNKPYDQSDNIYVDPKQFYDEMVELEQEMKTIDEIEHYAKKIHELNQENQDQEQDRQIYEEHPKIDTEEPEHIAPTTKKPGFWRRLGSSISKTYESAKEKIKEKLGKK